MKVILKKHIDKVGAAHEVKEVSDGYARNFLLKRGLAVLATPEALAQLDSQKAQAMAENKAAEDNALETAKRLATMTLTMTQEANEKGTLFAAIAANEIVDALDEQHQMIVSPTALKQEKPIKETGVYDIAFDLGFGDKSTGTFKLEIQSR